MTLGTYYVVVQSMVSDLYNLTITQQEEITGLEAVGVSDIVGYYEIGPDLTETKLRVMYRDGSSKEVAYGERSWDEMNIQSYPETTDGTGILSDENGYIPIGTYQYVFFIPGLDVKAIVPFTVKSWDEMPELCIGEEINISENRPYQNRYYKIDISTSGAYKFSVPDKSGQIAFFDENHNYLYGSEFASNIMQRIDVEGMHYIHFYTYDDGPFSFVLEKQPEIKEIALLEYSGATEAYYGFNSWSIGNVKLRVIYENGSSVDVTIYDEMWHELGFCYSIQRLNGDDVLVDTEGRIPPGEYQYAFYIPSYDAKATVPVTMKSWDEMPELQIGELQTIDCSYSGQYMYYKVAVTDGGVYKLKTSDTSTFLEVIDKNGSYLYSSGYYYTHTLRLDTIGNYYLRISSGMDQTYSFIMEKQKEIQEIEVIDPPAATETYYGFGYDITGTKIRVLYDDGQEVEALANTTEWGDLNVQVDLKREDGTDIILDDKYNVPIGDYQLVFYIPGYEVQDGVDFMIKSWDEMPELTLGETEKITGTVPNQNMYYKIAIPEAGVYRFASDVYTYMVLYDENHSTVYDEGTLNHTLRLDKAGNYYLQIRTYENTYSLTVQKQGEVSQIEILENPTETTVYYGLGSYGLFGMKLRIIYDDGQSVETQYADNMWYELGMKEQFQTAEGDMPVYDENSYLPVGDYQYVVYISGYDARAIIPFAVKSWDEMPAITLGEKITVESVVAYQRKYYKLEAQQAGTYYISTDVSTYLEVRERPDKIIYENGYANKHAFRAEQAGTYYLSLYTYVNNSYGLEAEKAPEITKMELLDKPYVTETYYGYHLYYYSSYAGNYERGAKIRITYDNGESIEVSAQDDSWYDRNMCSAIRNLDNTDVKYDDRGQLPAGKYQLVFWQSGYEEKVTVPYEVKSWDEMPKLTLGEKADFTGTRQGIPVMLKLELPQAGSYHISANISSYIQICDAELVNVYSKGYKARHQIYVKQAGTYCLMVWPGGTVDTLSILMEKVSEVKNMEVLETPYNTETYYGITNKNDLGAKLRVTFEDDTVVEIKKSDALWDTYGVKYDIMNTDYTKIKKDAKKNIPVGIYQYVFTVSGLGDIKAATPYQVKSWEELPELEIGEKKTVSVNKASRYSFYKVTLPEAGLYAVNTDSASEVSMYEEASYSGVYKRGGYYTKHVISIDRPGTYCIKIRSRKALQYQMSVEKTSKVTQMKVVKRPDVTQDYYGFSNYGISGVKIRLTYEDGSTTTVAPYDKTWNECGMYWGLRTVGNKYVYTDSEGNIPVGTYRYVFYSDTYNMQTKTSYTVRDWNDMPELKTDKTVEKVSTKSKRQYVYYKVNFEKAGHYVLHTSEYSDICVYGADRKCLVSEYGKKQLLQVEEAGWHYVRICANSKNYEVYMENIPKLTTVDMKDSVVLYSELDYTAYSDVIYNLRFELGFDDGTKAEMHYDDETWDDYGFGIGLVDSEDEWTSVFGLNPGTYYLRLTGIISKKFPVVVRSLNDAPELKPDTKVTLEKPYAVYKITVPSVTPCEISIATPGDVSIYFYRDSEYARPQWSTSMSLYDENAVEMSLGAGNTYLYIRNHDGNNSQQLQIHKMPTMTELKPDDPNATIAFTYGTWGYMVGETLSGGKYTLSSNDTKPMQPNAEVGNTKGGKSFLFDLDFSAVFSDGSLKNLFYNSYLWKLYGITQKISKPDGSSVMTDERGFVEIGEYIVQFIKDGVSVRLPFAVTESESVKDIRKCVVTVPQQTYTGAELKPVPTVKYGDKVLQPDTDYFITYQNNVKVGTGGITLKGRGAYSGTLEVTFAIEPVRSIRVSFDSQGGSACDAKEVLCEGTYGELPTPVRSGYTFTGWYTSATGGDVIAAGSKVAGSKDMTLYARWEVTNYTITYNLSGGSNDSANPIQYNVTTATITLKDAARAGYRFGGWYSDASYQAQVISIGQGSVGNIILYAKWEAQEYTITYNLAGGTNNSANPSGYTIDSETIALQDATRAGYQFSGWYSDTSYQTKVTEIGKGSTGDRTLYAKWEAERYTITYNLAGGTNDGSNPDSYTIESDTITLKNATRKGYNFAGWYFDEAYTEKATEITKGSVGNKVVYAKWSAQQYKITYKLNQGKNSSKNPKKYTIETQTFKLQEATRAGYTFAGWYADAKFKKKVTKIAKGSTGDITLYAKWTANKYTIKFNGNGATSGKMSTLKNVKYDKQCTLKKNAFKKKGYVFVGWNTKKNGKGKSYKDKAKVKNLTTKNKGTVTLYAQWKKK